MFGRGILLAKTTTTTIVFTSNSTVHIVDIKDYSIAKAEMRITLYRPVLEFTNDELLSRFGLKGQGILL